MSKKTGYGWDPDLHQGTDPSSEHTDGRGGQGTHSPIVFSIKWEEQEPGPGTPGASTSQDQLCLPSLKGCWSLSLKQGTKDHCHLP